MKRLRLCTCPIVQSDVPLRLARCVLSVLTLVTHGETLLYCCDLSPFTNQQASHAVFQMALRLSGSGHSVQRSCKNEREEIRKRLAMSTEDDISFGADEDSNETLETLSPRKQRLQARLQGAPSGMQICFMNDDVPDDDDEDELENSASNDQDDEELGKIK
ncbi:schwannomin-interacting protein 1, partial [Biomphalaria glabrata]